MEFVFESYVSPKGEDVNLPLGYAIDLSESTLFTIKKGTAINFGVYSKDILLMYFLQEVSSFISALSEEAIYKSNLASKTFDVCLVDFFNRGIAWVRPNPIDGFGGFHIFRYNNRRVFHLFTGDFGSTRGEFLKIIKREIDDIKTT